MRMQALILATLAACGCQSISSTDGCMPGQDDFTLALDLDEQTVQDLLNDAGKTEVGELDCQQACTFVYHRDRNPDWPVDKVTACTLAVDSEPMGDPAAVIGDLSCEGAALEYYCVGRRPIGHVERAPAGAGLPAFLAHCAHLEAASVLAFTQLAGRLLAWGAPAALIERCRQAADDEVEHAEILGALAREGGSEVAPADPRSVPVELADAALDNAVEGCVHEAWSALGCAVAAVRATTPDLRAAHARLAADEVAHAQLAWDLHTWFMGQVSSSQREAILRAQRAAIAGLPALARAQVRGAPAALGLPDAHVAARFAAGLAAAG